MNELMICCSIRVISPEAVNIWNSSTLLLLMQFCLNNQRRKHYRVSITNTNFVTVFILELCLCIMEIFFLNTGLFSSLMECVSAIGLGWQGL